MNYSTWKKFYQWGWATKSQIAQAVQQGIITDAQYEEIVGVPYPVAKPVAPIVAPQPAPVVVNPTSAVVPVASHTVTPIVVAQPEVVTHAEVTPVVEAKPEVVAPIVATPVVAQPVAQTTPSIEA